LWKPDFQSAGHYGVKAVKPQSHVLQIVIGEMSVDESIRIRPFETAFRGCTVIEAPLDALQMVREQK
jgi:hypothetical protein